MSSMRRSMSTNTTIDTRSRAIRRTSSLFLVYVLLIFIVTTNVLTSSVVVAAATKNNHNKNNDDNISNSLRKSSNNQQRILSDQDEVGIVAENDDTSNTTSSSSSSSSSLDDEHLTSFDYLYLPPNNDTTITVTNITRSGIVDRISFGAISNSIEEQEGRPPVQQQPQQQHNDIGICHIATFLAFSYLDPPSGRRYHIPMEPITIGGVAAVHLAIDMLNKGDGSVISEIHGINETCPIRFTTESFDESVSQTYTIETLSNILNRQTSVNGEHEREICAVIGALQSAITMPMAILTGIAKRPQLSPWSVSTQLDDKDAFPLFGRLITSELGLTTSYIFYLKRQGITKLGVIHWNDDYGNAFISSLLQQATIYYPILQIISVDLPRNIGSEPKPVHYQTAVETLAKTQYRYFLALIDPSDFLPLMTSAIEIGIGGTGDHVWMLNSAAGIPFFTSLILEKNSPLALSTRGVGMLSSQNGRPGMDIFDKFVQRRKKLDNDIDKKVLLSKGFPTYDGQEEEYVKGFYINSTVYEQDPSVHASVLFDETIMLGLAACKAASLAATNRQEEATTTIYVDGTTMYDQILHTTFQGATGTVILDPTTGSRLPTTAMFRITNVIEVPFNETHVTYQIQDSDIYMNGEWLEETPYIFSDGTTNIPLDLPPFTTNFNYIGTGLRAAGLTLAGMILLLSVLFAGWTIYSRNLHVVRASQPIFLLIVCGGSFVMGSAIIPLSLDDEIISHVGCSIACMAVPWLGSVGFALIFAALFSKTWRVNRLFHQPNMRRVTVSACDVMSPLIILLAVNVNVLSIWTAVSPLVWRRIVTTRDVFDRPIESRGYCTSDQFLPFAFTLVAMDMIALLFASYQSYVARGISTEFAESESIGKAIVCMLLVSFMGVPTMIIVSDDTNAKFYVLSGIIFVVCTAVLLFIFVPKFLAVKKMSNNNNTETMRASGNPMGQSIQRSLAFVHGSSPIHLGSVPEETTYTGSRSSSHLGVEILHGPPQFHKLQLEKKELQQQLTKSEERVAELQTLLNTVKTTKPSEVAIQEEARLTTMTTTPEVPVGEEALLTITTTTPEVASGSTNSKNYMDDDEDYVVSA